MCKHVSYITFSVIMSNKIEIIEGIDDDNSTQFRIPFEITRIPDQPLKWWENPNILGMRMVQGITPSHGISGSLTANLLSPESSPEHKTMFWRPWLNADGCDTLTRHVTISDRDEKIIDHSMKVESVDSLTLANRRWFSEGISVGCDNALSDNEWPRRKKCVIANPVKSVSHSLGVALVLASAHAQEGGRGLPRVQNR